MTLREIKRTGELAQPSFAFAPRVRWIFFMWLVTTAAIFAMALGAFAKASAKIRVSSRARNDVGAENKRMSRETKWQGERKAHGEGNDFTKRNCARSERRKVTLRGSRRRKQQRRGRRRKQRRKIKMSTNSSSYLGENIFFIVCREIIFSEWERL